jgi:hypothetical protein
MRYEVFRRRYRSNRRGYGIPFLHFRLCLKLGFFGRNSIFGAANGTGISPKNGAKCYTSFKMLYKVKRRFLRFLTYPHSNVDNYCIAFELLV